MSRGRGFRQKQPALVLGKNAPCGTEPRDDVVKGKSADVGNRIGRSRGNKGKFRSTHGNAFLQNGEALRSSSYARRSGRQDTVAPHGDGTADMAVMGPTSFCLGWKLHAN